MGRTGPCRGCLRTSGKEGSAAHRRLGSGRVMSPSDARAHSPTRDGAPPQSDLLWRSPALGPQSDECVPCFALLRSSVGVVTEKLRRWGPALPARARRSRTRPFPARTTWRSAGSAASRRYARRAPLQLMCRSPAPRRGSWRSRAWRADARTRRGSPTSRRRRSSLQPIWRGRTTRQRS